MTTFLRKHLFVVALAFAFSTVPAHATKWASATFHTKQPIDQVFEPTAKLIANKEWYVGTRWHIQAADPRLKAITATTVSFGRKWGDIYIWMRPEGTGTCIQTVMTLDDEPHLHPADYAPRFGKALKTLFPTLLTTLNVIRLRQNFTSVALRFTYRWLLRPSLASRPRLGHAGCIYNAGRANWASEQ